MLTLYHRLGGATAIESLVTSFYDKIMGDDRINYFFEGVDMNALMAKQRGFLTMVLGGPQYYQPIELRHSHERLIKMGLNDTHFDVVIEHLRATLEGLNLSESEITTVIAIAETTRKDVLNR
ncbi:MAG: group 1 truncated hemoglobin [Alphaproteobacteria bacterium]|nr:MAG: group 1 truncated hemoglobin [Alphaproteobacteria bacterium]